MFLISITRAGRHDAATGTGEHVLLSASCLILLPGGGSEVTGIRPPRHAPTWLIRIKAAWRVHLRRWGLTDGLREGHGEPDVWRQLPPLCGPSW